MSISFYSITGSKYRKQFAVLSFDGPRHKKRVTINHRARNNQRHDYPVLDVIILEFPGISICYNFISFFSPFCVLLHCWQERMRKRGGKSNSRHGDNNQQQRHLMAKREEAKKERRKKWIRTICLMISDGRGRPTISLRLCWWQW